MAILTTMPRASGKPSEFQILPGLAGAAWALALLLSVHVSAAGAQGPPDSTALSRPDSAASSTTLTDSTAATPPSQAAHAEKRGLYGRAERGAKNFLSDTWWVFSSPARLNRNSALATAVFFGAEAVTYAYDEELYDATQRNKDMQPFKGLMNFADEYIPYGFMPNAFKIEAPVALLGYAIKSEPLQQIPVECIESHLIAGALRNILKPIVGRAHPYENLGPHHFEFNQGTSFPSGHTSVLFE